MSPLVVLAVVILGCNVLGDCPDVITWAQRAVCTLEKIVQTDAEQTESIPQETDGEL